VVAILFSDKNKELTAVSEAGLNVTVYCLSVLVQPVKLSVWFAATVVPDELSAVLLIDDFITKVPVNRTSTKFCAVKLGKLTPHLPCPSGA
jgi:hypothetical protein